MSKLIQHIGTLNTLVLQFAKQVRDDNLTYNEAKAAYVAAVRKYVERDYWEVALKYKAYTLKVLQKRDGFWVKGEIERDIREGAERWRYAKPPKGHWLRAVPEFGTCPDRLEKLECYYKQVNDIIIALNDISEKTKGMIHERICND